MELKNIKKLLTISATALPFIAPKSVQAQTPDGLQIPTYITGFFSITSIGEFIGAILSLMYIISGVIFFVQLVVGGFQWIISAGDTENARNRITSSFVGLAIVALSYAAIILIEYFFGIKIIGDDMRIPLPYTK